MLISGIFSYDVRLCRLLRAGSVRCLMLICVGFVIFCLEGGRVMCCGCFANVVEEIQIGIIGFRGRWWRIMNSI